jgi:uncharacterized protein
MEVCGMSSKAVYGVKGFLYLFGLLILVLPAQGASFDCGKAGSKVEHIICDNPEISKLDEELSALYKVAQQDSSRADATHFSQKQWIEKYLDRCMDAACVNEAYGMRVKHLQEANGAALSAPEWSKEKPKGEMKVRGT